MALFTKRNSLATKKETRQKEIRAHLLKFGNISSIEAINIYGNTRLAATIFDIKDKKKGPGWHITDKWEASEDSRYKRYFYDPTVIPEPVQTSLFAPGTLP